jgi:hypothetical protein
MTTTEQESTTMRSTLIAAGAAAAALAGTVVVGGTVNAANAHPSSGVQPIVTMEKGIVLECTGEARGLSAYVNLYENNAFTNYVQVVLDDNPKLATSREPKDIWSDGLVKTSVEIKGKKARITGTASKLGKRSAVHEEIDDAGYRVVSDGWHRQLEHDLTLTYGGTAVDLTCAPAFFYKLEVTKTPIV